MEMQRHKIEISGTVQGIGFRPFVYKTALKHNIAGFILNNSNGVLIEAEGKAQNLKNFSDTIKTSPPPFSQIIEFSLTDIPFKGEKEFQILKSKDLGKSNTLISPDIATCNECLAEIDNQRDRRFEYAFTNCTNCGPRYTIIEKIPYDRPLTSMKDFLMCEMCLAEYQNPMDRRYHAQPNACPVCGPNLVLMNGQEKPSTLPNPPLQREGSTATLDQVIHLLKEGKIIAIKGLGGFHLACDPANDKAVKTLRERKHREEKPFALMFPTIESIKKMCIVSKEEEELINSSQKPITLLRKKDSYPLSCLVAPNNIYVGAMLSYTPLHHILLKKFAAPLIMTSANITDDPICFKNSEAFEKLSGIADYFLIHNRKILTRIDDSIVRVANSRPLMLRRARGYAPQPVFINSLKKNKTSILAVGGDLKNSSCHIKNNTAFLGQYIGDLSVKSAHDSFESSITHISKLFDIKPQTIACDLHPDYFSTRWAKKQGLKLVEVQHHHAHIASCMAENNISDKVIGIALDGTGYGTDGAIWGGEIMLADFNSFERVGHIEYMPLAGGDSAAKKPWIMALAYILKTFDECNNAKTIKKMFSNFCVIKDSEINLVISMINKNINTSLTSSCGRLFDAISSILNLTNYNNFEGQAGMALEMEAYKALTNRNISLKPYCFTINPKKPEIALSYKTTLKGIVEDLSNNTLKADIAYRFHLTMISSMVKTAELLGKRHNISEIALSGGCFQNIILLEGIKKGLESKGFKVYTHSQVPPNDQGIALGQAVIAVNRDL